MVQERTALAHPKNRTPANRSGRVLWRIMTIVLCGLAATATGRSILAQGNQVFGLKGSVVPAIDQSFSVLFTEPGGNLYGLVGATPAVDAQLGALAARRAEVKVWGEVRPPNELSTSPVIVVSEVVEETLQPTPTPSSDPTATITVYAAYVRSGPGVQHPPLGSVNQGTLCRVTGRTTTPGWWRLACPGVAGWVKEGLYSIQGDVSKTPLLAVAPSGPPRDQWRAVGFANPDLAGSPTVTFDTPTIAFDWGAGSPNPALPPNNFSLRFERVISFAAGVYRLESTYDDGVRIYVGGQLVIDDWREGAARTAAWQGTLSGDLPVRIDYVEYTGLAQLIFAYRPAPPAPTPAPVTPSQPPSGAWVATYYGNSSLSEPALFSRVEPRGEPYPLNYEFSLGSAVPGVVPDDNWSGRWRGRFYFDAGDYRFLARGNDGVRVYLDGIRLIDAWPNSQDTVSNTFRGLGAGEHEVTVDFYDVGGLAWVRTWWEKLSGVENSRDQ